MKRFFIQINCTLLTIVLCIHVLWAQQLPLSQIVATPMALNPSFTGMFDGSLRASVLYSSHTADPQQLRFKTSGASVDMPLLLNRHGDYLAAGTQFFRSWSGSLGNTGGLFSVSFHKFIGESTYIKKQTGCDFGMGVQLGFGSQQFDATGLFFGSDLLGSRQPVYRHGPYNLSGATGYLVVSTGICFSQIVSSRLNYALGLAAFNLNQPSNSIAKDEYAIAGIGRAFSASLSANCSLSQVLTIKPASYYINRSGRSAIMAGAELIALIDKIPDETYQTLSVFGGAWLRDGFALGIDGGIELCAFRVGLGYDCSFATAGRSSFGSSGFELTAKYVAPVQWLFSRNRVVPSGHF